MPFVAAPNIIEVEWLYTLNAQKCENRLMFDNFAVADSARLEDVAVACWNWWEETYSPEISEHCTLRGVQATDLSTIDGAQFLYAPDSTTTGGISGAAMPNEVSLCVSLRTGNRGRSARGRWFLAGLPREAMDDDNNVNSGYATSVAATFPTLFTAVHTIGPDAVIVSYISENAPRVGGPVYFTISDAVILDTLVDSQRRRKPGVGT